jgi:hypothetical protein
LPVLVAPMDISTNGASVTGLVVVQTVFPSGTVQLTAVS